MAEKDAPPLLNQPSMVSITVKELAELPESIANKVLDTVKLYIETQALITRVKASQARFGVIFGSILFAMCVGGFIYLVHDGHPKSAGVLLGTAVLGFLSKILGPRG